MVSVFGCLFFRASECGTQVGGSSFVLFSSVVYHFVFSVFVGADLMKLANAFGERKKMPPISPSARNGVVDNEAGGAVSAL